MKVEVRRNRKVSLLCISFIAIFVGNIFASEVVDDFPKGSINWSKGIVTAKGSGVPPSAAVNPSQARLMAERAAISDARRNLIETVGEVRVDASSTVSSMMTKNDVITSFFVIIELTVDEASTLTSPTVSRRFLLASLIAAL